MICKVDQITKNSRYKVLNINRNFYILDMDCNFWVFLFPFLYWLLPHKIFKIDQATVEKINIQQIDRKGTLTAFGFGGISIVLGNLMKPAINYFEIDMTIMVKLIILFAFLVPVIWIRYMLSNMNRNKLLNSIHLAWLKVEKVRIRPESIRDIMKHLFLYFFCWTLAIFGGYAFLTLGNIFALFGGLLFLLIILILNSQVIQSGKAKVTFIQ